MVHKKNKSPKSSLRHETLPKHKEKLNKKFYEKELVKLQIELVKLHEWIKSEGLKVVVIFEGRDAAGKGDISGHRSRNRPLCRRCISSWFLAVL